MSVERCPSTLASWCLSSHRRFRRIKDNRELEARVRQAEAAAAEARAGRDDACAERDSLSRDLLSAKTMVCVCERESMCV